MFTIFLIIHNNVIDKAFASTEKTIYLNLYLEAGLSFISHPFAIRKHILDMCSYYWWSATSGQCLNISTLRWKIEMIKWYLCQRFYWMPIVALFKKYKKMVLKSKTKLLQTWNTPPTYINVRRPMLIFSIMNYWYDRTGSIERIA